MANLLVTWLIHYGSNPFPPIVFCTSNSVTILYDFNISVQVWLIQNSAFSLLSTLCSWWCCFQPFQPLALLAYLTPPVCSKHCHPQENPPYSACMERPWPHLTWLAVFSIPIPMFLSERKWISWSVWLKFKFLIELSLNIFFFYFSKFFSQPPQVVI